MVRRGPGKNSLSDEETKPKFEAFAASIRSQGGQATTFYADGTNPEEMRLLVESIENEIGAIDFALYNIGAQVNK